MGSPVDSTKDFMDMKADEVKLKATESLALVFNKFFTLIVILMVALILFTALAFGGVLLLGDLIGSYAAGAFIVAGVFLVVLIILICLRKKLFLNSFVQLFIQIFYGDR